MLNNGRTILFLLSILKNKLYMVNDALLFDNMYNKFNRTYKW